MSDVQETMQLPLPIHEVEHLSHMPETGMGYHLVEILFDDGSVLENVVVLNCLLAEVPMSHAARRIVEVRTKE